jgi:hypothetical protein
MKDDLIDFLFAIGQRFLTEEQEDGSVHFTLYDMPFDLTVTADQKIEANGETYDSFESLF